MRRAGLILFALIFTTSGVASATPEVTLVAVSSPGGTDSSFLNCQADGYVVLSPNEVPFVDSHSTLNQDPSGSSISEAAYDLSNQRLLITFSHARTADGFAQSAGEIYFTVDTDTPYALSGVYTAVDSEGRSIKQSTDLTDLSTSQVLFDGRQQSLNTLNQSFSVGGSLGDFESTMTGSISGTLFAGNTYKFGYNAFLDSTVEPHNLAATATGYFRLAFIPEPNTALLLGIGMMGLGMRRRRLTRRGCC